MSLSPDMRHHIHVMLKQIKSAPNDTEAFGALCTALVVISREAGFDPHLFVTKYEKVYDRMKAEKRIP